MGLNLQGSADDTTTGAKQARAAPKAGSRTGANSPFLFYGYVLIGTRQSSAAISVLPAYPTIRTMDRPLFGLMPFHNLSDKQH